MPHQCYKSIRGYISLQRSFLLPKSVLPFSLKNYRCVWSITRTYVFQNSYFCRDVEQPVNGTLFFQRQAGDGCATVKAVPSTEKSYLFSVLLNTSVSQTYAFVTTQCSTQNQLFHQFIYSVIFLKKSFASDLSKIHCIYIVQKPF